MELNQGLLRGEDASKEDHSWEIEEHSGAGAWWKLWYIGFLHVLLAVVCFRLLRQDTTSSSCLRRITKSPASSSIEYEARTEHATDHHKYSKYSGPPSSEGDEAWLSLVKPTLFGATTEEMVLADEALDDAVELAESVGFLASLGVHHEMHCLRRLRFYLYKEIYYPNITASDQEYYQSHLDHCIETIRISLMCTADVSLYTFHWENDHQQKPTTRSNSKRYCAKWEKLQAWSLQRTVGMNPLLRRPDRQSAEDAR